MSLHNNYLSGKILYAEGWGIFFSGGGVGGKDYYIN